MRFSATHCVPSSLVASTVDGCSSSTMSATVGTGAIVVVIGSSTSGSLPKMFMKRATSTTMSTTATRTPSALLPGVARSIGGGATGIGAVLRRAPQASQ